MIRAKGQTSESEEGLARWQGWIEDCQAGARCMILLNIAAGRIRYRQSAQPVMVEPRSKQILPTVGTVGATMVTA